MKNPPTTAEGWATIGAAELLAQHLEDPKGELPEPLRARIHALTRKVTMSDEEIPAYLNSLGWWGDDVHGIRLVKDLRDRYEERGKYAPESTTVEQILRPMFERETPP